MNRIFIVLLITLLYSSKSNNLEFIKEIQKIVQGDRVQTNDEFGFSVAIDGNYAIVGALEDAQNFTGGGTLPNAGSAYIFEKDSETGEWEQVRKLVASDRESQDKFGISVSISGDYAIIGAYQEDHDVDGSSNEASHAGSAYIFERNNSGLWVQMQKIVASDREADDHFGISVGISGGNAVVGAYEEAGAGSGRGAAYFFELEGGSGTWSEVDKVTAGSNVEDDALFGSSVAISSSYSLIGAPNENEGGTNRGAAYIFELDNGSWTEINRFTGDADNNEFGYSVAITGINAIIGAPFETRNGNVNAGAVHFYDLDTGVWDLLTGPIDASDLAQDDNFGISVSISGDNAIIGANNEDEEGTNAGAAYVFQINNDGTDWVEIKKITASDGADDDEFGISVGISGENVIVGAYLEDEDEEGGDTKNNLGSAYLFSPDFSPSVSSLILSNISANSASFTSNISDGGASTTVTFELGTSFNNFSSTIGRQVIPGNSTTISISSNTIGLIHNTEYFVRVRATNTFSTDLTEQKSFWTLDTEPTQHPEFGQVGEANTTISLTFSSANDIMADGYVLIRSGGAIGADDLPNDATTYVDDNTIGDATVIEVITDGSATSTTLTNLSTEKSWQFALIPYNEGSDPSTINYLTDEPASIQGYTIPTLGEWGMIVFSTLMLLGGVWYTRKRA